MKTLVSYAVTGAVARLTLDSPHNRNALSSALVAQLRDGLRRAAGDAGVRAVVLGHTGGTFCAGADLSEATGGDPFDGRGGPGARVGRTAAGHRGMPGAGDRRGRRARPGGRDGPGGRLRYRDRRHRAAPSRSPRPASGWRRRSSP